MKLNVRKPQFEKIMDFVMVFYIIAWIVLRPVDEFYRFWPIARILFWTVVIIKIWRYPYIKKNMFYVWIIWFVTFALFVSAISQYPDNSLQQVKSLFEMAIQVLAIVLYCQNDEKIDTLFTALWLAGLLIVVFQLTQFNLSTILGTDSNSLIGLRLAVSKNENANITAYNLIVSYMSGCYLLKIKESKYKKLIIISMAFIVLGMLLTGARKTFFVTIPATALLFIGGRHKIAKTLGIIIGCYVIFYLVLNVEALYNLIGWRIEMTDISAGSSDASSAERLELLIGAINTGANHILGVGLNNYIYYNSVHTYAHNNMAEIFADLGLLGLGCYYSYFGIILYKILNYAYGEEKKYWLILIAVILALEMGQISYSMFSYLLILAIFAMKFTSNNCKLMTVEHP